MDWCVNIKDLRAKSLLMKNLTKLLDETQKDIHIIETRKPQSELSCNY